MVKSIKCVNVTYKGVTYDVELNNSTLFIGGSYICPFEYDGIDWRDEQHLIDEIYDCVGGWVEGYEIYSLRTNLNKKQNVMSKLTQKQQLRNQLMLKLENLIEIIKKQKEELPSTNWDDDTKYKLDIFYSGKISGLEMVINDVLNQIK